jgi:aryl-alcohol dehydrogenase-like predicted oxidoreductase
MIAGHRGSTMSQVALAWLAARPAVSSVILGARTPDQLTTNLATDLRLSTDETALLDKASAPHSDFAMSAPWTTNS